MAHGYSSIVTAHGARFVAHCYVRLSTSIIFFCGRPDEGLTEARPPYIKSMPLLEKNQKTMGGVLLLWPSLGRLGIKKTLIKGWNP